MGRKSLATERTNQILDAFEACVIKHGLDAVTLQQTADAANVNLGMIHHYVGRRDDLLEAMVSRLIKRTMEEMALFDQHTAEKDRLNELLSDFFSDEEDQSDKIIDALYVSGGDNQTVHSALSRINQTYVTIWAKEIQRIHPDISQSRCDEIALAVLWLAYSTDLVSIPGVRSDMWRVAAETLINNP